MVLQAPQSHVLFHDWLHAIERHGGLHWRRFLVAARQLKQTHIIFYLSIIHALERHVVKAKNRIYDT